MNLATGLDVKFIKASPSSESARVQATRDWGALKSRAIYRTDKLLLRKQSFISLLIIIFEFWSSTKAPIIHFICAQYNFKFEIAHATHDVNVRSAIRAHVNIVNTLIYVVQLFW